MGAIKTRLRALSRADAVLRNLHLFRDPDGGPLLFDAASGLHLSFGERTSAAEQHLARVMGPAREIGARPPADAAIRADPCAALQGLASRALPPPPDVPPVGEIPTLSLHTSFRCNLRCAYCYAARIRAREPEAEMDERTIRRSLDWFAATLSGRATAEGLVMFNLGGEPLASWDRLMLVDRSRKDVQRASGVTLMLGVVTNGTLLTRPRAEALVEHGIEIVYSLDGPEDIHDRVRRRRGGGGSYAAAVKHLPHALVLFPRLTGSAVLTPAAPSPRRAAEHLLSLGFANVAVKPVRAAPADAHAFTAENLDALEAAYVDYARWLLDALEAGDRQMLLALANYYDLFWRFVMRVVGRGRTAYRCPAAGSEFAVAPDGRLYPCDSFVGMEAFCIGDVWAGPRDDGAFGRSGLHVDRKRSCRTCWARYLCGGGCYYTAYLSTGDCATPDPVECRLVRRLIEIAIWFAASLAQTKPTVFAMLVQRIANYSIGESRTRPHRCQTRAPDTT